MSTKFCELGGEQLDKLEKIISEKREAVERLRRSKADLDNQIIVAEAELAAFEAASALRPIGQAVTKRGRQPGSISEKWKRVLARARKGGPWDYEQLKGMAASEGMDIDLPSLRDRVRYFVKADLMRGNPHLGFIVTDEAAARFGFNVVDVSERLSAVGQSA